MAQSSVSAIKELKKLLANQIESEHKEKKNELEREITKIVYPENKKIVEDVVKYAESKYPVKEKKKCDYKSTEVNTDEFRISFDSNFTNDTIQSLREKIVEVNNVFASRKKELEKWEFEAINAAARREQIPEFNS